MAGEGIRPYFCEKEAARILGKHPDTLRRWRKAGKIAYYDLPGGRVEYRLEDLQEFLSVRRVEAVRR